MKFFGWLLYIGSIVWGAMIIADPGKVAGMHFDDEDCKIHAHGVTSHTSLTCHRCQVTAIHHGKLCKSCNDAEQHFMDVTGDSKPGIRLAEVSPNSAEVEELHLKQPAYLGAITPFHLQFTVGSILLPLLIGTYCIFAVEHDKAKK